MEHKIEKQFNTKCEYDARQIEMQCKGGLRPSQFFQLCFSYQFLNDCSNILIINTIHMTGIFPFALTSKSNPLASFTLQILTMIYCTALHLFRIKCSCITCRSSHVKMWSVDSYVLRSCFNMIHWTWYTSVSRWVDLWSPYSTTYPNLPITSSKWPRCHGAQKHSHGPDGALWTVSLNKTCLHHALIIMWNKEMVWLIDTA